MAKTMYDSVTSADIPAGSQRVAGYVDGKYVWSGADWSRHAGKSLVRIAVFATTRDGHVLDVEQGNATPAQAVDWVLHRRAAGADPTVYMSQSIWAEVRNAFAARNVVQPHYWVANWDGVAGVPTGAVAKQYKDSRMVGAHYDVSITNDYWPGVDPKPAGTPPIVLTGTTLPGVDAHEAHVIHLRNTPDHELLVMIALKLGL